MKLHSVNLPPFSVGDYFPMSSIPCGFDRPFVVLISGAALSGKSTVAAWVASCFGVPTLLDSALVSQLADISKEGEGVHVTSLCSHVISSVRSGKSIVVEGVHVDSTLVTALVTELEPMNVVVVPIWIETDEETRALLLMRRSLNKQREPLKENLKFPGNKFFVVRNSVRDELGTCFSTVRDIVTMQINASLEKVTK